MATKKKRTKAELTDVKVTKLSDDPICLRASIGGRAGKGFYISYRGDEREVIEAVEQALAALKTAVRHGALGVSNN
jgi:hypothetical protein